MAGVRREDIAQLSVPIDEYQRDVDVGKIPLTEEEFARAARAEDDFYPGACAHLHAQRCLGGSLPASPRLSLFYKQIDQPIETVKTAGTDDNISLTFINAESADVYGLEPEFLHGLGWIGGESSWANAFFVSGSMTLSESNLKVGDAAPNLTSDERELWQHAPWVVNLQLGYDAPNAPHRNQLPARPGLPVLENPSGRLPGNGLSGRFGCAALR